MTILGDFRSMDHKMRAIRQRMEGVLWEVLSLTNTNQAQFNKMMDYIMGVVRQVEREGYPRLGLSGRTGNMRVIFEGHELEVPPSGLGIALIQQMLKNWTEQTKIGMPGELTQWHIDRMVKQYKAKQPAPGKPDVEVDLKDLGL